MACPISTRMFYKRLQIVDDREMSDSEEEDTAANSEPEPSDDEFTVETEEDDEIEGDTSDHFDEVETDDIEPTDVAELPVRADVVKSRDGTVNWSTIVPRPRRAAPHNIIRTAHTGEAAQGINPADIKEAFALFISDDMVSIIVLQTNQEGQQCYGENWKETDSKEITAFFGLLLLAGVYRSGMQDVHELWQEESGPPRFRATMSRERFKTLLQCIRFDDLQTRDERRKTDRMAAIRECFEIFVKNCKSRYVPNVEVTVDEQLYPWRGRVKHLKVYIPSKLAKYGLKFWVAADAQNSYCINLQLYTGKIGVAPERRQGARVVFDLCSHLLGSGRNITTDNLFTDLQLAKDLLQEKTTLVGTMRKSKREVPLELLPTRKREVLSTKFVFAENITLCSYVPKKNKAVILLSSMHHDAEISAEEHKKPQIILDYNSTKGGVDNLDKLVQAYSCQRKTNRWPLVVFFDILDIAAVNGMIIWCLCNPDWQENNRRRRRMFIKELAKQLTQPLIERRAESSDQAYRKDIRRAIESCGVTLPSKQVPAEVSTTKRKRCHICTHREDRKTSDRCSKCELPVCRDHAVKCIVCLQCNEEDEEDEEDE